MDAQVADIATHRDALAVNAFDYNAFCKLILSLKTAKELGSEEYSLDLEAQRTLFAGRFLPGAEFWLDWIPDKIAAAGVDHLEELDVFFLWAVSQCPTIEIVKEWVDNAYHRYEGDLMTSEALKEIIEKAIGTCGADIMEGATIWARLIEVLIEELDDLNDSPHTAHADTSSSSSSSSSHTHTTQQATQQAMQHLKESIVSTYRRQFSLPLLGNQKHLKSFETTLSEHCIESDVSWIKPEMLLEKFQRSEEQLKDRIIYESNIISDEFLLLPLGDQVVAWRAYIKFEIDAKQLPRAIRLYKRCLLTCHQSIDIWTEYTYFASHTLKQWNLAASITERGVKVHRGNIAMWMLHFLAVEMAGTDKNAHSNSNINSHTSGNSSSHSQNSNSKNAQQDAPNNTAKNTPENSEKNMVETLSTAIQTALTCPFHSADDYLAILLFSCDFRRRGLKRRVVAATQGAKGEGGGVESEGRVDVRGVRKGVLAGVADLRQAFNDAETFLEQFYPEWGGGWLQIYKYRVAIEDEIIGDALELFESGELASDQLGSEQVESDRMEMGSDELGSGLCEQLGNNNGSDGDNNDENKGDNDDILALLASRAGEIWERGVTRFSKYYFIWGEYIQWGRAAGDFDLCRGLYSRGIKAVKDVPEELCKGYVLFEQQVGTLDGYLLAKSRGKVIMRNASVRAGKLLVMEEQRMKAIKKKSAAAATVSTPISTPISAPISAPISSVAGGNDGHLSSGSSDTNNDNSNDYNSGNNDTVAASEETDRSTAKQGREGKEGKGGKESRKHGLGYTTQAPSNNNNNNTHGGENRDVSEGSSKRQRTEGTGIRGVGGTGIGGGGLEVGSHIVPSSSSSSSNNNNNMNKNNNTKRVDSKTSSRPIDSNNNSNTITTNSKRISISNLSFKTPLEEILTHFKHCGIIKEGAHLLLSKAGASRGKAVLDFTLLSGVSEALKLNKSELFGREIEVTVVDDGESGGGGGSGGNGGESGMQGSSSSKLTAHHPTTVFVSKFDKELTSDQLRGIFGGCGDVLEAKVNVDKRTGQSKCTGLVQFFDEESRKKALLLKHDINGQKLSVLPSKFGAIAEGGSYYGPNTGGVGGKKEEVKEEAVRPPIDAKKLLQFKPRKLALQVKP